MPEGEGAYHFNSHGVRDKDAKRMAKEDSQEGSSEEGDDEDEEKEGDEGDEDDEEEGGALVEGS